MFLPRSRRERGLAVAIGVAAIVAGALLLLRRPSPAGSSEPSAARSEASSPRPPVLEPPRGEDARVPPAAPPAETREDPPAPPRPAIATTIRGRVVDAATDEPIDAFEILCAPAGAERHLVDTLLGMESSTASA